MVAHTVIVIQNTLVLFVINVLLVIVFMVPKDQHQTVDVLAHLTSKVTNVINVLITYVLTVVRQLMLLVQNVNVLIIGVVLYVMNVISNALMEFLILLLATVFVMIIGSVIYVLIVII